MRGIAVIDRQGSDERIAIWIVCRQGMAVINANAVVIDPKNDSQTIEKVSALTHSCAVLVTEGTVLDGLSIDGEPLKLTDVDVLLDEVEAQQARILDGVADYKRRTRTNTLVEPTFPFRPKPQDFTPLTDSPAQRALSVANYAGRAWSAWLRTDEERRRRTAQPKTGETPWIMPREMNSAIIPDFPEAFAACLRDQFLRV